MVARTLTPLWGLFASVLVLSLPGIGLGAEAPRGLGDPMLGKELLTSKGCINCHSIWGAGGDLGPDFARVSSNKNLPEILGDFWNHTPRMIEFAGNEGIEWPRFEIEEMENVISYLYFLNIFDRPGDPEEGRVVFHRKRCDYCHSVGTFGTARVKPLDRFSRYITPMPLAQAMWNTGARMIRKQQSLGIEMPWFEGREMGDIQAFIRRYGDRGGKAVEFKQPPNPFEGEKLFHSKKCDRCHSLTGKARGGIPSLEMIAFQKTLSEISGILWDHSYKMRARMRSAGIEYPIFEGNEMADLIAFLYYYPFYREVGDVETGRKLFSQKGCVTCHGVKQVAEMVRQSESEEIKDYYIGFATAMWNHAPTMRAMLRQKKIEWPKFYGKEMRDLVTYIYREGNH